MCRRGRYKLQGGAHVIGWGGCIQRRWAMQRVSNDVPPFRPDSWLTENRTTTGLDVAIATISKVVQDALGSHLATRGQLLQSTTFSQVWVGMAGYDRLSLQPRINGALSELFSLTVGNGLRVTSDIDLLPAALSLKKDITSVIVLVVGTGSVAMSYTRDSDAFKRIGRVGGWGRILGDDGSGYATGREGIRRALRQCDLHRLRKSIDKEPARFPPLPKAILKHFQSIYPECDAENLLSTLLVPPPETEGQEDGDVTRTKNIASAASVVLSLANEDAEARKIVEAGAASVGELVEMLIREQEIDDVTNCALVLGGGLMGNHTYQEWVLNGVQHNCGIFGHTEYVDQPAMAGAKYLLDRIQNPT